MPSARTMSLLKDPIPRLFWRLSPPAILGMLVSGLYNFVDGVFVGQITGPQGLAAITASFPLTILSQGISALVGVGSAALYSRLLGAGDKKAASSVLPLVILLNLAINGLFVAAALPFLRPLLIFLGAQEEAITLGIDYARIVVYGAFFGNLASSVNMLIRAEGHMGKAMVIVASGAVANIILDPIFMLSLGMGIKGAAWATVASQALSAILSLGYFIVDAGVARARLGLSRSDLRLCLPILSVGCSALALPTLSLLQSGLTLKAIAVFGRPGDLALVGSCLRIYQLMIVPLWGTAQSLQPLLGTNYGAGYRQRMRASFWVFTLYSSLIALILWLPVLFIPRQLLGLFISDAAMIGRGSLYLRVFLVSYPLSAFMLNGLTLFQAINRPIEAACLAIGKFLVLFAPFLFLLSRALGPIGVFLASPAADLLTILLGQVVVFRALSLKESPRT